MSLNRRHLIAGLSGLAVAPIPVSAAAETRIGRLAREIAAAAPEDVYGLERRLLATPAEAPSDWPLLAQVVSRWDRPDRPFMWASRQLLAAMASMNPA